MKKLLFMLLAFCTMPALSAGYSGTGVVSSISSIYLTNGKPEFELYGTWPNKQGCTATRIIVGRDAADNMDTVKSMYSMLLAAYTSGKTTELYIDCVSNVPVVKYVWLPDSPSS